MALRAPVAGDTISNDMLISFSLSEAPKASEIHGNVVLDCCLVRVVEAKTRLHHKVCHIPDALVPTEPTDSHSFGHSLLSSIQICRVIDPCHR